MTTSANPVNWFEIYVKDMTRAKRFYESILAVTLEKLETPALDIQEMWKFPAKPDGSGAAGSLVRMPGGPEGGNNSVIVYFSAEDCGAIAKKVPAAGGKIFKDKFAIGPYGYIALI